MTAILRRISEQITERVGPEALATILSAVVVILAVLILLLAVPAGG